MYTYIYILYIECTYFNHRLSKWARACVSGPPFQAYRLRGMAHRWGRSDRMLIQGQNRGFHPLLPWMNVDVPATCG